MLSDPREEQFDMPAATVLLRDRECRQCEVVDRQNHCLAGVEPRETDAPQRTIEAFVRVKSSERHRLIAAQPVRTIHRAIALKARRVTDSGQCLPNSHLTDSCILRCAKS
jgi:hypothetical protein